MIKSNLKSNVIICAGKNCKNLGSEKLEIKFINKVGYFCYECTSYLLKHDLASKINKDKLLEESLAAPSNKSFIPREERYDYF
jgi:hypothetical protein